MSKTDEQWCQDNGVPDDASHSELYNGMDVIKIINAKLKKHNLIVRTKHRRGHGTGSYVWVEMKDKNES